MSFSYERYDRQQRRLTGSSGRSTLGYWVPLIVTVTAATAGIAAWVWNERSKGSQDDEYEDFGYYDEHIEEHQGPPPPSQSAASSAGLPQGPSVAGSSSYGDASRTYSETYEQSSQNDSFVSQMRGAIRRTPSPQKMLEGATKRVSAGMAAIGRGLGSISEEGKGDDFVDHERWSEEADSRERDGVAGVAEAGAAVAAAGAGAALVSSSSRTRGDVTSIGQARAGSKRTVAIVVSAESSERAPLDEDDSSYHIEHASLLSHLIGHVQSDSVQLLILIYAPHLQTHPLSSSKPARRPSSTESFADVGDEANADPEAEENNIISAYGSEEGPALYKALATQAASLVSHSTQIMPFTSWGSQVHMLRHLAPSLVYMEESLCGDKGEMVQQIDGWIGQCVVVIGAEGAGLVDTETEDEGHADKRRGAKWWQDDKRVGLGKGVELVESTRLGEDWAKRVEAH